jgi:hypothetical protein
MRIEKMWFFLFNDSKDIYFYSFDGKLENKEL